MEHFGEPIFRILLFFRELAEELFFLLLKLSYLLPAEGVHEAQDHEDEEIQHRRDEHGIGEHHVQCTAGDVGGVQNIVGVADAQQRHVHEYCRDGLAELAHEGEERVARRLVMQTVAYFVIVDSVGCYRPYEQEYERVADAGQQAHREEHPYVRPAHEVQREIAHARHQHSVGADLAPPEARAELARKQHDHRHGEILAHRRHHRQAGGVEVVVEKIGVIALAEHLRGEEQHTDEAHRHIRLAVQQNFYYLPCLPLLLGRGLRGDAFSRPAVAQQICRHRQRRDDGRAREDLAVRHHGCAVGVLDVAEADEQHRGHRAEGRAYRAEHRQG